MGSRPGFGAKPQGVDGRQRANHATKIDGIAIALKALGKTLEMRAV